MAYAIIQTLNTAQKAETKERTKDLDGIYTILRAELETRDLSDIPTDRLIQLIVLLNKQMDDQNVKVNAVTYKTGL